VEVAWVFPEELKQKLKTLLLAIQQCCAAPRQHGISLERCDSILSLLLPSSPHSINQFALFNPSSAVLRAAYLMV
jgi:hypothetical protein